MGKTLTSPKPVLHRWLIQTRSMSLNVSPFGEHHVILCINLCCKKVFPKQRLLYMQNDIHHYPTGISRMRKGQWCLWNPTSWLNCAFMSPITILRSCLCISGIACFTRTSPTLRMCFLSLQEYKIFFPSLVISPLPVQQTSLMPRKSNRCCSNSLSNWFNQPLLMKCASVPSSHLGDDFWSKCHIRLETLDSTMGLVKHLYIRIYIPKIQGPASNFIQCIFSRRFCSRFVSYRDGFLARHQTLPFLHPGLGLAMAELKPYQAT